MKRKSPNRHRGEDRRIKDRGHPLGMERRSGVERRHHFKIPIFIKLITLSALVTLLFVTTLSIIILGKQKVQFQDQLIAFGKSTLQFAAEQLPDKLLAEEDLLLFQTVNNLAEDRQVLFALVVDSEAKIKAHSIAERVNDNYQLPEGINVISDDGQMLLGTFELDGEENYYFEQHLRFQNINVGTAALALTQMRINQNLRSARHSIFVLAAVFIILGALFSCALGAYFSVPIQRLKERTIALREGHFDQQVLIARNDELGDLGIAFNQMARGLQEREKMRQTLELAMEIQRSLLPGKVPSHPKLDIAGQSIYCDETGGDYYDFIGFSPNNEAVLRIVIGDVSGHGVPSALVMTTARALIRQRSQQAGRIDQIVTDVNRLLSRDIVESGNFMTLFYLEVNLVDQSLNWVRAGHDPAIVYDPQTDTFEELRGAGIPLGIDDDWEYTSNHRKAIRSNQIIVMSTDGVWETFNAQGEMLGKDPIYRTIREHKAASATEILKEIISTLNGFRHGLNLEDDVTLVVLKVR